MQWAPSFPPWVYFLAGMALLGLLLIARWLAAPSARSLLLLALRFMVLAVLLVILLDPVRVSRSKVPGRVPSVAYLVDGSRSMGLEKPVSRLESARQWISTAGTRIEPERLARVVVYEFGRDLAAVESVGSISATSNESKLSDALERLPSRLGDDIPRALVVFSDGRDTDGVDYLYLAPSYKKLGIPIHVVPKGDPSTLGDVAVRDLVIPRAIRPGMKVPVRVVVGSVGFAGRRTVVSVRSRSDSKRAPFASLPITLVDGEVTCDLVLDVDQAKGGLFAEVQALPGEAVVENNRVPFQLTTRDPRIRVIYMEGTLSDEYHFIRDALVEDPNIECLSLVVDGQNNQVQRLHRVNDPSKGYPATHEELFGYDVVICSDIARSAFTPQQLAWTVELVAKRGGGFAMIGGNTSFGAGQWDQTIWDGMIPVDMTGSSQGGAGTLWGVTLKTAVPRTVQDHPIWQIVDDPIRNRQILSRIPPFYGSNLTDRLKPAALALGVSDRPVQGVGVMPLLSCQPYGKGRSLALSSDSTVDWGRDFERIWGEGDNRYFRKFWRNVVRWLAENSDNGNSRLKVETDKILYRPGERVRISAQAFDEHAEETKSLRLVARLIESRTDQANEAADRRGETTLSPLASGGPYHGELTVPSPDQANGSGVKPLVLRVTSYGPSGLTAQADFEVQVVDDSPEFRDPRPDRARLEELAHRAGGRVLESPEALAEVLRLDGKDEPRYIVSRTPAWDHPALWLLLLGLLTAEWVVRRARGLA